MSQRLRADGVPMIEFRANTQNFSPSRSSSSTPRCARGRIAHDGNPVLEWCIGNVVGKLDARGQRLPDASTARAEDRRSSRAHDGDRPLHGRQAGALGLRDPRHPVCRMTRSPLNNPPVRNSSSVTSSIVLNR